MKNYVMGAILQSIAVLGMFLFVYEPGEETRAIMETFLAGFIVVILCTLVMAEQYEDNGFFSWSMYLIAAALIVLGSCLGYMYLPLPIGNQPITMEWILRSILPYIIALFIVPKDPDKLPEALVVIVFATQGAVMQVGMQLIAQAIIH